MYMRIPVNEYRISEPDSRRRIHSSAGEFIFHGNCKNVDRCRVDAQFSGDRNNGILCTAFTIVLSVSKLIYFSLYILCKNKNSNF